MLSFNLILMQKTNLTTSLTSNVQIGKPTQPYQGKQRIIESKGSDPSSSTRVEKYPVPSFYEYRVKPKEFDPL